MVNGPRSNTKDKMNKGSGMMKDNTELVLVQRTSQTQAFRTQAMNCKYVQDLSFYVATYSVRQLYKQNPPKDTLTSDSNRRFRGPSKALLVLVICWKDSWNSQKAVILVVTVYCRKRTQIKREFMGGAKMAEEQDGENTFSPTNSSKEHLNAE